MANFCRNYKYFVNKITKIILINSNEYFFSFVLVTCILKKRKQQNSLCIS